ncbi:MAG TPA: malto-oligosyltrehalose synthase [Acidimicrobiales bacterium]|jgi:(1->4)-alpha-D-glucan 1-alpha-D-glucosylmutase|nr:malto-oligosyltrehalose synthase [Acidimicrobiales bacterium]
MQLQPAFGFDGVAAVAHYLQRLGVSHVYLSPVLQAMAGSTHGYDVVDEGQISAVLGGETGYEDMSATLAEEALGQILDVVPNHMAVDGRANRWWWDVLEHGPSSRFAGHFDIDWFSSRDKSDRTVLMPVLADHYGRVIEAGDLKLAREGGTFRLTYFEHEFPLSLPSLVPLLQAAAERAGSQAMLQLAGRAAELAEPAEQDDRAARRRQQQARSLGDEIESLLLTDPQLAALVDDELGRTQDDSDLLEALIDRQYYRLAYWRTASEEVDYRRFFNIDSLVGLRVEEDRVFASVHETILRLMRQHNVDGLRIDHIDGLRDPAGYLAKMRQAVGARALLVEKILAADEELPESWPVDGTTGYEFANAVNNLLVDQASEAALTAAYTHFTGDDTTYEEVAYQSKRRVLDVELASELDRLTRTLADVCDSQRRHRDHTTSQLREALQEVIVAMDVYRTYAEPDRPVSDADRSRVASAVLTAAERRPDIDLELLGFIGDLVVLGTDADQASADDPSEHAAEIELALRTPQLSSAVAAKGVEDTAFYRYHRLLSLNEVGGNPGRFGWSVAEFHEHCRRTADRRPGTMLTLSTHDTKRSADVRARLDLLSEIPELWTAALRRWSSRAERHWAGYPQDRQFEYLLHQTLVGTWPISADRLTTFVEKAIREAKLHTSWDRPDAEYEAAVARYVDGVMGDDECVEEMVSFLEANHLVELGRLNSLVQTTLLLTCPGVPDIYQGDDLWQLRLVDPDNRSPVDYAKRCDVLETVDREGICAITRDNMRTALLADDCGSYKLWLTSRILRHRRRHPAAYSGQHYEPLPVSGLNENHVVAFTRGDLVVVVPRLVAKFGLEWADTSVELPAGIWQNILTTSNHHGGLTALQALTPAFPVVVLHRRT